jgi:hypothetical protein
MVSYLTRNAVRLYFLLQYKFIYHISAVKIFVLMLPYKKKLKKSCPKIPADHRATRQRDPYNVRTLSRMPLKMFIAIIIPSLFSRR